MKTGGNPGSWSPDYWWNLTMTMKISQEVVKKKENYQIWNRYPVFLQLHFTKRTNNSRLILFPIPCSSIFYSLIRCSNVSTRCTSVKYPLTKWKIHHSTINGLLFWPSTIPYRRVFLFAIPIKKVNLRNKPLDWHRINLPSHHHRRRRASCINSNESNQSVNNPFISCRTRVPTLISGSIKKNAPFGVAKWRTGTMAKWAISIFIRHQKRLTCPDHPSKLIMYKRKGFRYHLLTRIFGGLQFDALNPRRMKHHFLLLSSIINISMLSLLAARII